MTAFDSDTRELVPIRPLLVFIVLTPLIPRPTVSGLPALLAPAFLVFILIAFFICVVSLAKLQTSELPIVGRIFFLLLVPTLIYGIRILAQSQWSEEGYFAAKLGMSVGGLVILLWLYAAKVDVQRVYKALLAGYIMLAVLMMYVGVTGQGVFEPARPSRSYGLHIPLFKAAGVPRSYGELAIFSSLVLAYLLVYRREMKKSLWLLAVVLWFGSELVAQSRTGFIAGAVVLIGFASIRMLARRAVAFLIILGSLSIPVAAQLLYPSLQSEPFISDVIGQNIIQQNVTFRVDMYATAFSSLSNPSISLLTWGIDREQWFVGTGGALGTDTVLHNYFLSTLMFFGVLGGSLTLLGLVIMPLWRLASSGLVTRQQEVAFLATIGMVTSLQFYEGFFSLILMLQLAVLWYVAYGAEPPRPVGETTEEAMTEHNRFIRVNPQ
jgi:hypothetical protein